MKTRKNIATVTLIYTMFLCVLAVRAEARNSGMANENYYGFVHYNHYAGRTSWPDYLEKVESVGAGWIQAEGPETESCSVSWDEVVPWNTDCDPENAPDLDNPEVYQWESMNWVREVADRGMGAVLDISPGGGANSTSCWTRECNGGVCPPKDEYWDLWYKFVFHVVDHFDGTHVDHAGKAVPEVRYFTSVEEAGEGAIMFFYGGDAADLLGARLDRTDPGNPAIIFKSAEDVGGTKNVPEAIVPVANLAVHDANPDARYVLGAMVGGAAKYAYAHLYSEWVAGRSDDYLDALARSYNVRPASELRRPFNGYYTWEELFNADIAALRDSQELLLPSFAITEHYDVYGIHLYDGMYGYSHDSSSWNDNNPNIAFLAPEGFQLVINWLSRQVPDSIWITGTGLWPNPYIVGDYSLREQLNYNATHVLKTITVAHATGVEWMTYSSIHQPGGYGTLADIMWWGLWPYEKSTVEDGTAAADTFSLMAELIPTGNSVTRKEAFEYRDGIRTPVETDAADRNFNNGSTPDPWSGDAEYNTNALLYKFDLDQPAPHDHVAVGWCVDKEPSVPESFDSYVECDRIDDICEALGVSGDDTVTVYDFKGRKQQEIPCSQATITFEQAPFVMTWEAPTARHDNQPPVAQVFSVDIVSIETQILLDASESFDPDGNAMEFHWSQEEGPESDLIVHPDGTAEALVQVSGRYSFSVRVFDGRDWSNVALASFDAVDRPLSDFSSSSGNSASPALDEEDHTFGCVTASNRNSTRPASSGILSLLIVLSPALAVVVWRKWMARGRALPSLWETLPPPAAESMSEDTGTPAPSFQDLSPLSSEEMKWEALQEIPGNGGTVRDVTGCKLVSGEALRAYRDRLKSLVSALILDLELVNQQLHRQIMERRRIERAILILNKERRETAGKVPEPEEGP